MKTALQDGVFPSASLLVAKDTEVVFKNTYGDCSEKTIFDVASLTKPVITTTLAMIAVKEGLLNLEDSLVKFFPNADQLKDVKVFQLLNHSSGLPGWKPFYKEVSHEDVASIAGRKLIIDAVLREPLEYKTGSKSIYSDLGFILLDVILESIFAEPLISIANELITKPLGMKNSFYRLVKKTPWSGENFLPAYEVEERDFSGLDFAPTQDCPWRGEVIQGLVDDQNCYAMGGVSGHAGLFSTTDDLHLFVTELIRSNHGIGDFLQQETVREFINYNANTPAHLKCLKRKNNTFALGWDHPKEENSQAGNSFSKHSIGHLAYTGCSIWINLEKNFWVILLTNRVHPATTNEKIKTFRPTLHDQIVEELGV